MEHRIGNKDIFSKWLDVIVLYFLINTTVTGYEYFSVFTSPITFSFLWLILPIPITYLYFKKRNISKNKLLSVFIFCFLSTTAALVFNKAHKNFPFKAQYVGIYSNISTETEYSGRYDEKEGYTHPFEKHGLYKIDDMRIESEIEVLEKSNEIVNGVEFLFWQTGFSQGYTPKYIPFYNDSKNILTTFEYFLTIGPLVLLETILISLKYFLINIIVFLTFHTYLRMHRTNIIPFKIPFTDTGE
ncbi:MAG: hypothetical protein EOP45_14340 [Sphingobacteriaceae bacterium]|nr:MAG: hypothetical protein EOP45_14340 [Sphingobacteriaceae bacterium]